VPLTKITLQLSCTMAIFCITVVVFLLIGLVPLIILSVPLIKITLALSVSMAIFWRSGPWYSS
jgi:hypothetical protein